MEYGLYTVAWIFLIYAVLGWCAEVAFAAVKTKSFVNRGFLNGPYCPIYGAGMLIVVLCLTPIRDNLFFLFAGSFLLTSLLELVTGFVLEKFFDDKWWDYSDLPLNIHGYVCLYFSVMWGVACVLIMKLLHPAVERFIRWIPRGLGLGILIVFFLLFLADAAMTVSTLLHLKRQLKLVTEINRRMRRLSDMLGEGIYSGTMAAMEAGDKAREELEGSAAKASAELEALKQQSRDYISKQHFGTGRLLKAFPNFRQGKLREGLDTLLGFWEQKRHEKTNKNQS